MVIKMDTPSNIYRNRLFKKLNFIFEKNKKVLDIGCGEGFETYYFANHFKCKSYGIDIIEYDTWDNSSEIQFRKGSIKKIPFPDNYFDYVFIKDVMHHIDEITQDPKKIIKGFRELKRVCKSKGHILIVESNRYNPISYFHMVLLKKHNHYTFNKFKTLVFKEFKNPRFHSFESHVYPNWSLPLFIVYESLMETMFKTFLSYNAAIVKK